jgi:GTP-binding protein
VSQETLDPSKEKPKKAAGKSPGPGAATVSGQVPKKATKKVTKKVAKKGQGKSAPQAQEKKKKGPVPERAHPPGQKPDAAVGPGQRQAEAQAAGRLKPGARNALEAREAPPAIEAAFRISAAKPSQFPEPLPLELCLLGRSNSGKSSLLNRLLGRKALARVSAQPGRTRLINFFQARLGKGGPAFLVADLPGYGFAAAPKEMVASWQRLAESYLLAPRPGRYALVLMDIRRDPQEEESMLLELLESLSVPYTVVATKADKLSASNRAQRLSLLARALGLREPARPFSALSGLGREDLFGFIAQMAREAGPVQAPEPDPERPD